MEDLDVRHLSPPLSPTSEILEQAIKLMSGNGGEDRS